MLRTEDIGEPLRSGSPEGVARPAAPAMQQPSWEDPGLVAQVRDQLADMPGLVDAEEVRTLRGLLADAAEGRRYVLQAGDCAEDPAECTSGRIERKADLIDSLAAVMRARTGVPVVGVGRIAGQFAKPRSRPTEMMGTEIPVYRGHMVNSPEPNAEARRPDPKRLVAGYWAASTAVEALRARHERSGRPAGERLWISHEALLLDYEVPMVRGAGADTVLASTHWPWIGDRTRQVDGAHVALLSTVTNPVACKVGPSADPAEVVALCARLDPERVPGRLALIVRLGAGADPELLPAVVRAVRGAGHPVLWMCDPMHGNTVPGPDNAKTRYLDAIFRDLDAFHEAVERGGAIPGGLHLEATPDLVGECRISPDAPDSDAPYTSLCDPRLNPEQAMAVIAAWPRPRRGATRGGERR
ncbi:MULTISPECIES: 3-deoxy-7-phosphoheptulonate synthase [Nocardiopsis]|uniref:3-deoxy-7-phosphoheptulonate synthase n=1 Tax=Nocardiopsis TaxID=2013 RepID=UPI000367B5EF|nr:MULTISPECIES: 3-deoxy-7-phosphoheptulonate synthase [Nocardiopsis]ASU57802.1 phospho-2-dehydro-3-deoxyheptonate aldolase [Nocardiopsis dassonvillei]